MFSLPSLMTATFFTKAITYQFKMHSEELPSGELAILITCTGSRRDPTHLDLSADHQHL